jgi:hypothetical protein
LLLKLADCSVNARRVATEVRPNSGFSSSFLDHMSYAWQDERVGRSLRTTPFFTQAIPLQSVTGVLRMEKRRIAPRTRMQKQSSAWGRQHLAASSTKNGRN